MISKEEIRDLLEVKTKEYNSPKFISTDPISIPHLFSKKEDIEISAFLTATISWGQRPVIIRNANSLMQKMDFAPYDFVIGASLKELKTLDKFVHRTFNGIDAKFFVLALRNIYEKHNGLENVFAQGSKKSCHKSTKAQSVLEIAPMQNSIIHFRETFLSIKHISRSDKHISNPGANSSAKIINMFLRWMVRKDNAGVDFGIWNSISPALLQIPLDVHVGNVGRKLGLLVRKQDDWKAVMELTDQLRAFDKNDPIKYDFALFGLGIFEDFNS